MSSVHHIDTTSKDLRACLDWLLSRSRQQDMPGGGRTFRRKCVRLWGLWPLPPLIDEVHEVVYVDGIHLGRKAVVLIARTEKFVLGWYVARTERTRAWVALMERIAPPDVVITDGGPGFARAVKQCWPDTRVQRCTFHAFALIKIATTTRPRLDCSKELYALGKQLLKVHSLEQATTWLSDYSHWRFQWATFLAQKTQIEGRLIDTHPRLLRDRGSLDRLIKDGTLFTYLDPELLAEITWIPATNNLIEGGTNTQLRAMMRDHRGLSLTRRSKAIFWWCYQHTEHPLSPAQLLRVMPTDADIEASYQRVRDADDLAGHLPGWGDAITWSDLHHTTPRTNTWD